MTNVQTPGNTLEISVLSERKISPQHEQLVRDTFMPSSLSSLSTPTLYAMAGIPGSGKSAYVDQKLATESYPKNAFLMDPDRVMQTLPSYQDDLENLGVVAAFRNWELPARDLAYRMLYEAADKRLDIIQDMGAVRRENYEQFSQLKARGYHLHLTYVHCPVDVALRRLTGRRRHHTAPEMVRERDISLKILLPQYAALADTFIVLDNSRDDAPYTPVPADLYHTLAA